MGRAHRNASTFARLADPLGYVAKDDLLHAIKAIVATQRDYGERSAALCVVHAAGHLHLHPYSNAADYFGSCWETHPGQTFWAATPSTWLCRLIRAAAVLLMPASCRDAGRRDDRKQARLKYLVSDWGMPKFRSVVEQYLGKKFEPFR